MEERVLAFSKKEVQNKNGGIKALIFLIDRNKKNISPPYTIQFNKISKKRSRGTS